MLELLYLLVAFVLGVVASVAASRYVAWATGPSLEVFYDESSRERRDNQPEPHEFYLVKVRNRPARCPFKARRSAWACTAQLEVLDSSGKHVLPKTSLEGLWADTPIEANTPETYFAGARVDIHAHEARRLHVALKFEGCPLCYVFNADSYYADRRKWPLPQDVYFIHITVWYESGSAMADFVLENSGSTRDSVQIRQLPEQQTGHRALATLLNILGSGSAYFARRQ